MLRQGDHRRSRDGSVSKVAWTSRAKLVTKGQAGIESMVAGPTSMRRKAGRTDGEREHVQPLPGRRRRLPGQKLTQVVTSPGMISRTRLEPEVPHIPAAEQLWDDASKGRSLLCCDTGQGLEGGLHSHGPCSQNEPRPHRVGLGAGHLTSTATSLVIHRLCTHCTRKWPGPSCGGNCGFLGSAYFSARRMSLKLSSGFDWKTRSCSLPMPDPADHSLCFPHLWVVWGIGGIYAFRLGYQDGP